MSELHFMFSFHSGLLIAAALLLGIFSWWIYRITIPVIPPATRIVLTVLRGCAMCCLFMLIGMPLVSWTTSTEQNPLVCILIDDSRSMSIKDQHETREDTLHAVLRSPAWNIVKKDCSIRYVVFDSKARERSFLVNDSLRCEGDATDIAAALGFVKKSYANENLQSVVLITDGNSTRGDVPLYEADEVAVPIFTIGIGDTSEQKDVLVKRIVTNELAHAGERVPVNVIVHSTGFDGERTEVILRNDSGVVDRKILALAKGSREYSVRLSYIPSIEGMNKYAVEVKPLPGELTRQNNISAFFVKVLKSKLSLILIAGNPNPDAAFVRRVLEDDKNIEVKAFFELTASTYSGGKCSSQALASADCIILAGFPTAASDKALVQSVLHVVQDHEKPIFVLPNRTTDYVQLHQFDPILPFTYGKVVLNEFPVTVSVAEAIENNAVVAISPSASAELWNKLPPIYHLQCSFTAKPGALVLASMCMISASTDEPLMISSNVNKRKSLAILGYGIWRWKMLADDGEEQVVFDHCIQNAVQWLTTTEDERHIRVHPTKQYYSSNDDVEFIGEVYNDSYKAVDDAQIVVTMKQKNESTEFTLASLGNGQYQGKADIHAQGDYRYTASVSKNGIVLGTDAGVCTLGSTNEEFIETRQNKQLLQQLAIRSGGGYYSANRIESLAEDLQKLCSGKKTAVSHASDIQLWNSPWLLGLILIIFSVEWLLRKRAGML